MYVIELNGSRESRVSNNPFKTIKIQQVNYFVACRTGGLAGPARYTKARAKRENEREALSQNHPPVITPLFMLF